MIRTYRVTLAGIKGFYRVYKINSDTTLYKFHRQLQADLEFAADQPILFKGMDEKGEVAARYALIDLGNGAVDDVTIEDTIKAGVTSFFYFYDVKSKKSVIITLEGEPEKGSVDCPTIVDTKGPNPIEFENGYVAFEDLPKDRRKLPSDSGDDDDEDDEDDTPEEEEDDETEEIYDEKEEF